MTILASDQQRRHTIIVRLVLVGTRLDQPSHNLEVTLLASDPQRRHTIDIHHVQFGTRLDQQLHDFEVTILASDQQLRSTKIVRLVQVGTRVDQQPHNLEMIFLASDILVGNHILRHLLPLHPPTGQNSLGGPQRIFISFIIVQEMYMNPQPLLQTTGWFY